ncbi:MAG: tyrosine recombinase XerC [Candidatus Eisenbacteria bacterium]|nr:tyrosine recombinase XerC [Candidatus Eisenbacteria bacterium]
MMNLVEGFLLELKARGSSGFTIESYRKDLSQFADFVGRKAGEGPWSITNEEVRKFTASLTSRGYSGRSVARKLSSVRSFFSYLCEKKILSQNPGKSVRSPRIVKSLPNFLSAKEMEELFSTVEEKGEAGKMARAVLELLYSTGIRLRELVGLDVTDLNTGERLLRVRGKGKKERIVPVGRMAISAVQEYLAERKKFPGRTAEPLFSGRGGNRVSPRTVERIVKRWLGKVSTLSKLSPHVVRHSFATHLLDRGAEIRAVQKLLGHSSLRSTEIYTHVTPDRLKRAYSQAHPRA